MDTHKIYKLMREIKIKIFGSQGVDPNIWMKGSRSEYMDERELIRIYGWEGVDQNIWMRGNRGEYMDERE